MKKNRIFVAGHRGMVGSALVRALDKCQSIEVIARSREELDLSDARAVRTFFAQTKVDEVYLAAAKVGGIHANESHPADFLTENLSIQLAVIEEARRAGIQRLLFLGSSCIYPRLASQPIVEEALLSGNLEPTNEPYAIAKIAGIKLCESNNRQYGTDFRSVMPTNLYGPGDNFHSENSHVVPGLLRRFHEATLSQAPFVTVWGTGKPMREFLHVDDMAAACLHVMGMPPAALKAETDERCSHLNVGTGQDCTIKQLAETVASTVGFQGELRWDTDKHDGTPRKLLDVSRMERLGWRSKIDLDNGLKMTYAWFLEQLEQNNVRLG